MENTFFYSYSSFDFDYSQNKRQEHFFFKYNQTIVCCNKYFNIYLDFKQTSIHYVAFPLGTHETWLRTLTFNKLILRKEKI